MVRGAKKGIVEHSATSFWSASETTSVWMVVEVLDADGEADDEAVEADVVAGAGAGKGGRSDRIVSWLRTMIMATAAAAQSEVHPTARRRARPRPRRMMSVRRERHRSVAVVRSRPQQR